jgi:uncharacterized protein
MQVGKTMSLLQKIKDDLLIARKEIKDNLQISILRTLVSEASKVGFDDGKRESTDSEVVKTIKIFIKNLKDTIETAEVLGVNVDIQRREIEILEQYIPKLMSEEELITIVNLSIDTHKTKSELMRFFKQTYPDRYDGKTLARIVDNKLATL